MDAKPDSLAIIKSRSAMRRWCILAALALAPMPILHAYPIGYLYHLFELPPSGWTRFTLSEARFFALLGLPLAPIFLAWAVPGAIRPGLPMRSTVVLWLLVAYNPLQDYFESHFYGEFVARVADSFSRESPLIWSIQHLNTPLLIGLAVTALLRRHTVSPFWKILFHWGLFVCALWAAGHPYDSVIFDILLLHAFGM